MNSTPSCKELNKLDEEGITIESSVNQGTAIGLSFGSDNRVQVRVNEMLKHEFGESVQSCDNFTTFDVYSIGSGGRLGFSCATFLTSYGDFTSDTEVSSASRLISTATTKQSLL